MLHYEVDLDLRRLLAGSGSGGELRGRALLHIHMPPQRPPALLLDLAGLRVDSARVDGSTAWFEQSADAVAVTLPAVPSAGRAAGDSALTVEVFYGGVPRDGLVVDREPDGRMTAFADNWPNRARWWFPSNDHPSDKATVSFIMRVPADLAVVANGTAADTAGGLWRWATSTPIPTYTMVIGVAPFEHAVLGRAACGHAPAAPDGCVEVSVWALPGGGAFGVRRFARAADMVDFYTELVGPYPYEKLAHVQSTTRFGGMENASAIFYARNPWARGTMGEGVVAHETAHQWFGDALTEREWHDLWLSEGFASYFGPLYFEARDGTAALQRLMAEAREEVLRSRALHLPVVDSMVPRDLFTLLNANNYQKGAWVLHMLRGLLGDSTFFEGVRRYFAAFAHGNAATADFRRVMEETAGRDLGWFFTQWLYRPGVPQLAVEWSPLPAAGGREVEVRIRQRQPASWPTFRLPLELALRGPDGRWERHRVELSTRADSFRLRAAGAVSDLQVDPRGWVLQTAEVTRREP